MFISVRKAVGITRSDPAATSAVRQTRSWSWSRTANRSRRHQAMAHSCTTRRMAVLQDRVANQSPSRPKRCRRPNRIVRTETWRMTRALRVRLRYSGAWWDRPANPGRSNTSSLRKSQSASVVWYNNMELRSWNWLLLALTDNSRYLVSLPASVAVPLSL